MRDTMDDVRIRAKIWSQRAKDYRQRLAATGGLKRYEWWELEYFEAPYLALAGPEFLMRRFIDHFHNVVRLNKIGQIIPVPISEDEDRLLLPLFSHMNLEMSMRGGIETGVINAANAELDKYFAGGPARGVALFASFPETVENIIVKFSKKHHIEKALRLGELRMTPASHYAGDRMLKSQRDEETEREFFIDASAEAMSGLDHVLVRGQKVKIKNGFVSLKVRSSDYLLWSACRDIDRRLPTDFDADAALIIRDPDRFTKMLEAAVDKTWPSSRVWHGAVQYYDPCSSASRKARPLSIKHFSYYYQREWRFCAIPSVMPTAPVNISIGSLEDIAEMVTL